MTGQSIDSVALLQQVAGATVLPTCLGEYTGSVDQTGADNDLTSFIAGATRATGSPATLTALSAAGCTFVTVTVESANIRVSFFGADPSSNGVLYAKDNASPYAWNPFDLTLVKMAGQGGSATVRLTAWK